MLDAKVVIDTAHLGKVCHDLLSDLLEVIGRNRPAQHHPPFLTMGLDSAKLSITAVVQSLADADQDLIIATPFLSQVPVGRHWAGRQTWNSDRSHQAPAGIRVYKLLAGRSGRRRAVDIVSHGILLRDLGDFNRSASDLFWICFSDLSGRQCGQLGARLDLPVPNLHGDLGEAPKRLANAFDLDVMPFLPAAEQG